MAFRNSRIIKTPAGRSYVIKSIDIVPTGIEELDKLLSRKGGKGGIDIPGIYMIGGGPGTGKTLFALTLAEKACSLGATPIYFTIEETTSELLKAAEEIGIDLERCIKEGRMAIVEFAPRKGLSDESPYFLEYDKIKDSETLEAELISVLETVMEDLEAPSYYMLIFDSLPALTNIIPNIQKRDFLHVLKASSSLAYTLSRVITEADYTVEQYVARGVILLNAIPTIDGIVRYLIIPKMRARAHYTGPVPFDITSGGIKIYLPGTEGYEKLISVIKTRF